MSNILSFSLWGDKPIYTYGMLKNIELAPSVYPGWSIYVYHDESVPFTTLRELKRSEVMLRDMTNSNIYGMFWRFLANDENERGYTIFRDADSRLSPREKLAVEEWMRSGKSIHVMRDHPYHYIPYGTNKMGILGGMWGIKAGKKRFAEDIENFNKEIRGYGSDQEFLVGVYEEFQNDMLVHDEFNGGSKFPIPRRNYHFVGERFDENDNRFDDYKALLG